jgi:hypothetical protein
MDDKFPRFQYSIFDKISHDAQWVVRGNDWEQFLLDVEAVNQKVDENGAKDPIMQVTKNVNAHPCKTCNGMTEYKSGTSKAGKPWSGYFCQSNKDHVEWQRIVPNK